MKLTQTTLDKLEDILGESEFVVRYERGNFQSGWCLLEAKRIVVLNKFLNLEARINTLLELIPVLDIQFDKLIILRKLRQRQQFHFLGVPYFALQ